MTSQKPVDPVPAATMLLLRDKPEFQVLMVKRHHQIDFASGALVFPGGKPAAGDDAEHWADHCTGWDVLDPTQRALRIAAIREAYEEAGILLADTNDGTAFEGSCDLASRKAVEHGERSFLDVVREADVRLRLHGLSDFARWITPTFMNKRFDTWFYVARAPERQIAACDGYETVDAEWLSPAGAQDCITRAEARTIDPVLPQIVQRDGKNFLTIPENAGYGTASEVVG